MGMMFVEIDDIRIIVGTYIMTTWIMCFCVYLMLDFSRTEYYKCCSLCDHSWSRCCSAISKRAIQDSMMRELFWMLNGEVSNCNDTKLATKRYEDMKVIHDTEVTQHEIELEVMEEGSPRTTKLNNTTQVTQSSQCNNTKPTVAVAVEVR